MNIESAVLEYLEFQPRHGGIVVEQLETASGRVVFRRKFGWIIELTTHAVHIRRLGWAVHQMAARDLFRYAGQERDTPEEIEAVAVAEERARLDARAQLERAAISEFEHAFDSILPEYIDAPELVVEPAAE
jgi:hypothetical protein